MFWRTACTDCGRTFGAGRRRSEPEASPEANRQGRSGCAPSTAERGGKTAAEVTTRSAEAGTRRSQRHRLSRTRCRWPPQDSVPFLSHAEEQKLRFQGADHFAALRGPSRLGLESWLGRFPPHQHRPRDRAEWGCLWPSWLVRPPHGKPSCLAPVRQLVSQGRGGSCDRRDNSSGWGIVPSVSSVVFWVCGP
jgi:hypothetical protein